MRHIHVHRNTGGGHKPPPRFKRAHLPRRQTLLWLGPLFFRIAPPQARCEGCGRRVMDELACPNSSRRRASGGRAGLCVDCCACPEHIADRAND